MAIQHSHLNEIEATLGRGFRPTAGHMERLINSLKELSDLVGTEQQVSAGDESDENSFSCERPAFGECAAGVCGGISAVGTLLPGTAVRSLDCGFHRSLGTKFLSAPAYAAA